MKVCAGRPAAIIAIGVACFVLASSLAQAQPLPLPETGYVSQGTGFVVGASGYVLTNLHVVGGARAITVSIEGHSYAARIVGSIAAHDAALLKIEAAGLAAVSLGESAEVGIGDIVYAVGCPAGVCGTVTGGHVANLGVETTFNEAGIIQDLMMLDLTITHGSSGGPLVTERGQVVGITMGGIEGTGFGFAVPTADVASLLAGVGITPQALADHSLTMSEIHDLLLPAVAHIEADMTRQLSLPSGYSPPVFPLFLLPWQEGIVSGGLLDWATQNLGMRDMVKSGMEGSTAFAEWAGPALSTRLDCSSSPSFGNTHLSYSTATQCAEVRSLTVVNASSSSAGAEIGRQFAGWEPSVNWSTTSGGEEIANDIEQLSSEDRSQGNVALREVLSLQHGWLAATAWDNRGHLCCAVQYVLVGRVDSLVLVFAACRLVECLSQPTTFLNWDQDTSGVRLYISSGWTPGCTHTPSSVAIDLDQFRREQNTEATRVFNFILGQL